MNLPISRLLCVFALTPGLAWADISVVDAYVRSSGPTAPAGAAFMVIENDSDTEDRLVAAATDAAKRVELHTHKSDANGVMSMVEIEGGIPLAAHGSHTLQRGGDHVMLMGLTGPLAEGGSISLTLTFEKAGDIVVEVPVDLSR